MHVVFGLVLLLTPGTCPAGSLRELVSAGGRIRFTSSAGLREATVLSISSDALVVQDAAEVRPDTIAIDSLQALEVLQPPLGLTKGLVGGAILGGVVGIAVGVAVSSHAQNEYGAIGAFFGLPVGGLVGSVAGGVFAVVRGEHWEKVTLRSSHRTEALPPNLPLQLTGAARNG